MAFVRGENGTSVGKKNMAVTVQIIYSTTLKTYNETCKGAEDTFTDLPPLFIKLI